MSEGLQIARTELDRILSAADMPSIKAVLREVLNHCEWQERTIAEMSDRIFKLECAK